MSSDPYARIRCGTCGVSWADHPTNIPCNSYRPDVIGGAIGPAVAANLDGVSNPRTMKRYPAEVCPHGKTPPPLIGSEPVVPIEPFLAALHRFATGLPPIANGYVPSHGKPDGNS